jgi:hypothetical protein
MRDIIATICASLLLAGAALAGSAYVAQVSMGTNNTATVRFDRAVRGAVDTVYIAGGGAAVTGDVGVVYSPHFALTNKQVIVATNTTVTGTAVLRPRVKGTDSSGNALAAASATVAVGEGTNAVASRVESIPYERIMLSGEPVEVVVQRSATGTTWRVVLVMDQ